MQPRSQAVGNGSQYNVKTTQRGPCPYAPFEPLVWQALKMVTGETRIRGGGDMADEAAFV